ncbi:SH3 domain-containing protein [Youngiibacter fragilis]|uniref:Polysaccharide deacetylase n=1 Tax=Youngiibacter fragilis 232.1 TaxID=994573 RepID=V7I1M7_9CLOT|nr:SH3 domain-containing protein [Youngiibacter fragilis]ETA79181.1 polysaccharide deacetylase [Youngiibacter fragilis 232.1]
MRHGGRKALIARFAVSVVITMLLSVTGTLSSGRFHDVTAAEIKFTTANLNLRTGPGTIYPVITVIPKGAEVSVDSYSGNWAHTTYGSYVGYASNTYLASHSDGTAMMTTANLNFRTGPGTGYPIIMVIPKGSQVMVDSTSGGWAHASYSGKTGYLSVAYLTGSLPDTGGAVTRYTTADLNLRAGPGTGYAILAVIPRGTPISITSSANGWAATTYGGKSGYVSTYYLSTTPPGSTTPSGSAAAIRKGNEPYSGKRIALTFDDSGTVSQIRNILDILDAYGVRGTFFPTGSFASANQSIIREISTRGHEVENHTLSHVELTKSSDAEIRRQIREGNNIIRNITGKTPYLLRPPYGSYDSRVLRIAGEEGMKYAVLWSVDPADWASYSTVTSIINNVLSNASNNGIVLFHMHSYKSQKALPTIIQGLKDRGYTFCTVEDMVN